MADTRCSLDLICRPACSICHIGLKAIDRRSATAEDASGWVRAGDVVLQMLDGLLLL
jgi:hypothetical protein